MSEGVVSEIEKAVDLSAGGHDPIHSTIGAGVIAEADHILGPILAHAEPPHIYTEHLLGPDHTDAADEPAYVEVAHDAPAQLEPAQMEPAYAESAPAFVASEVNSVEAGRLVVDEHGFASPSVRAVQVQPQAVSAAPPAPRMSNMANSAFAQAETIVDPVMSGFDYVVALVSYAMLFVSVFLVLPAFAAAALAYAHRRDAHVIVRSHYRFQLRIFWTAAMLLVLGVVCLTGASVAALRGLLSFASDHLPSLAGVIGHDAPAWIGALAGGLGLTGVACFILAAVWTLITSLVGFFRLLGNRPIGHLPAGN